MLFQNIVKRKKSFGGRRMGGAGEGTASQNRGCTAPKTIWGPPVEMLLESYTGIKV
jgi:hypothetical protein